MTIAALSADTIDLSDREFWNSTAQERERAFAVLRRKRPVGHYRQPVSEILPEMEPTGNGYWAVTRHADVVAVSRDPVTFCSGLGIAFDEIPPEMLQLFNSFLAMDDPEHKRLRGLVHAAFSARQVHRIEGQISARARQIVDELLELGDCDFVEHVATRLPMSTLWDTWGVPEEERALLVRAVDRAVGYADPTVLEGVPAAQAMFEAVMFLREYAAQYAARRRAQPTDDLMTALVQAEVDGHVLSDDDIQGFFVLLAIAGLDTTRHTTSHALKALTDFPDQRRVLLDDLDGRIDTAVEEFVRWATPVMTFRRTATRDTVLGGQRVAQGDKVVLFYASANRDEEAFEQPQRFDVLRSPNRHVGFGGGGPHYCLGNQLARAQLKAIVTELLSRVPEIEAGEPELLVSSFIHGVKLMPCQLGARRS